MPVQDVGTPHKKKEHTNMKQLFIAEVDYQQTSGCSRGNIDNIRRILSSFFAWLEDEKPNIVDAIQD